MATLKPPPVLYSESVHAAFPGQLLETALDRMFLFPEYFVIVVFNLGAH